MYSNIHQALTTFRYITKGKHSPRLILIFNEKGSLIGFTKRRFCVPTLYRYFRSKIQLMYLSQFLGGQQQILQIPVFLTYSMYTFAILLSLLVFNFVVLRSTALDFSYPPPNTILNLILMPKLLYLPLITTSVIIL